MKYFCIFMFFLCWSVSYGQTVEDEKYSVKPVYKSVALTGISADSWTGVDKAKHFTVSMLLAGAAGWMLRNRWHSKQDLSRKTGAALILTLGISKEISDLFIRGHEFSWKDMIVDLCGVIVGGLLLVW